ncbi:MAG TPA: DUF3302 domain-containing protein [Terrimicrobiaceae bacterium]|nr:DUF3302 domain-containing protein [Terrimicrobiaceae bacterium]
MDGLSYFALGILFFVILTLAYGMIAIHDIPYHIAKKRNHPHQDAIHAGGWVSLFTLHAIWPFLWIWATSYDTEHGYRGKRTNDPTPRGDDSQLDEIKQRLAALEEAVHSAKRKG